VKWYRDKNEEEMDDYVRQSRERERERKIEERKG
jgi:hypothetical protein